MKDPERTQRFVGRSGVLRRLRRVMEDLSRQEARAGLVLVVGEEGVGKARLLGEVAEHAASLGVRCLTARPLLSAHAWYRPFTDLLAPGPSAVAADAPPAVPAPVAVPLDGAAASRLRERALQRLRGLAASRPVALFVHDVERADPFTVDLLDHLPRNRARAPAVVVASVVPDLAAFPYQRFRGEAFCRELHLAPWGERDIEQYLRTRPPFSELAGSMAEMLARRTGGKPSLVLQVLRLMEEEGAAPTEGMTPAEAMERLHRFRMPQDLEEVMARRLGCRDAGERRVLLALAALARPASLPEIEAATRLDREPAVQSLSRAEAAGLAVRRAGRGGPTWEVQSRAVGLALAHAAPAEEAAPLHDRVAAYLEALPGPRDPVEMATHHARAGHAADAAREALRARDAIVAARAFEQGLSLYEDCLTLGPGGRDGARLLQAASDFCFGLSLFERSLRYAAASREAWEKLQEPRQAAACRLREARIHQARSDFVLAARAAHEALARSQKLGDLEGQARALSEIGLIDKSRGLYDDAGASLERALRIQRERGDREGLVDTLNTLGTLRYYTGQYGAARALYEEARSIAEAIGDRMAAKRASANLANIELVQGRLEAAHAIYKGVLALERDLGDVYGESVTHYNIGLVMQQSMRHGLALRQYERAARLMERVGNRRGLHSTYGNAASVLLAVGDLPGCLGLLEKASRLAAEIGDRRAEAATLLGFGSYHAAAGAKARAIPYLEAALAKAIAVRDRHHEMEARYALALAAVRFGHLRDADRHLESLWEVARQGNEPELAAKAQLAMAQRHLRGGDGAAAASGLAAAIGLARRASSRALEIEAQCLLPAAHVMAGRPELASRERERARRMVKEVAARIGSVRLRKLYLESSPRREVLELDA